MAKVTSPYAPRHHALGFHARSQRFAVMVWHRRAGKTVACVNDLIDKALQCPLPMPRYSYVAPFYKQAKDVAWSYLKFYSAPVTEKVMESELSVQLINGATVRLYGADNPDALRGVYHDGIILDEYGDMQPRLFGEVIAPALADRKGWVAFIGTPKGSNHFMELWEEALSDARWFTYMLKASESGIIDAEELELLKNLPGSDEDTFQQEFECDWHAANKGAYYGKQLNELEAAGHMGSFPYDPDYPVITGWDLGWSDDTSVWFAQRSARDIKIIDFFSVSGWAIEDIVSELRSKPYAYGDFYLPHDAKAKSLQTGKSIREQLWGHGIQSTIVPNLSVQDGIQAVRKTLPSVYFNTDNEAVRKEGLAALKTYQRQFDDKRQVFKQSPLHDWSSNPADAFRYLSLGLNPFTASRNSQPIAMKKKPEGRVLNLQNLFQDREARAARTRI